VSATLQKVHAKRHALESADQRVAECSAALKQQQEQTAHLRRQHEAGLTDLVESRARALTSGTSGHHASQADLALLEIDVEASRSLESHIQAKLDGAKVTKERAQKAYDDAVCDYAVDLEAAAIRDVEAVLAQLSSACSRAIAAAVVSKDHGRIRGSYNLETNQWFGSAGELVHQLRGIKWPTWPTAIAPGDFKSQYNSAGPNKHPGVDQAVASIKLAIAQPNGA